MEYLFTFVEVWVLWWLVSFGVAVVDVGAWVSYVGAGGSGVVRTLFVRVGNERRRAVAAGHGGGVEVFFN